MKKAKDSKYEWFRCYQEKLLGALVGLTAEQGYLYTVIILRIFSCNGPCPDSIAALSRRTGMTRTRVTIAKNALLIAGKIFEVKGGLMNSFAQAELARRELASCSDSIGDALKIPQEIQQMLPLREEEKKKKRERSNERSSSAAPELFEIPEDWTPSEKSIKYASTEFGLTAADIDLIATKMKLHAQSNALRKANWDSYFRTWVVKDWEIRARDKAIAERRSGYRGPSLADIAMGITT